MDIHKFEISVITFVYADRLNGRIELLEECLKSVAENTKCDYEHIIVDDGSTVDLTLLTAKYPNVRVIQKPSTGILSSTETFNLGHINAYGKYCIYLASDDLHCAGGTSALYNALEKSEANLWAIGNAQYDYSDGTTRFWKPNKHAIVNDMDKGNFVNGCAVMWRNCEKVLGDLPPNYTGFCSDYDLWCTLIDLGEPLWVDHEIVRYREARDSTRHKTKTKLITSARVNDQHCFQYSKAARINNVQDRFKRKKVSKNLNDIKSSNQINIEIFDCSLKRDINTILTKREWNKLDDILKNESAPYLDASKKLENERTQKKYRNVVFKKLNLASICLMQIYKYDFDFIICLDDNCKNDWHFEFLPVAALNAVVDNNMKQISEIEKYLGLSK